MTAQFQPEICLIWAQDRNRVIGIDQAMAWNVPGDTQFFRAQTSGHPVVMGRKTWEALNCKPLPKRHNIVISQQLAQTPVPERYADCVSFVATPEAALTLARTAASAANPTVWVIGGGMIYRAFMPIATRLVVTSIDLEVEQKPQDSAQIITAPPIDTNTWQIDPDNSDQQWRAVSGDARWRVTTWVRKTA